MWQSAAMAYQPIMAARRIGEVSIKASQHGGSEMKESGMKISAYQQSIAGVRKSSKSGKYRQAKMLEMAKMQCGNAAKKKKNKKKKKKKWRPAVIMAAARRRQNGEKRNGESGEMTSMAWHQRRHGISNMAAENGHLAHRKC
jgi:hypothetical protein